MLTDEERADQILVELAKDPKAQMIAADARIFGELREQPGWQRLYSMVGAKRERWMLGLARRFMGPQKRWPAPEEIAYYQGYYEGAWWIIAHPEVAERNLERTARIAWAMTLAGEEE